MKLLFHFAYFSFFIPTAASVRFRNENDSRKLDGWFDEFETGGQCEQDSNLVPTSGQLKAMIFNMYLLPCAPGMGNTDMMPCQEAPLRDARTDEIAIWMKTRDEDVIMVQELFSYHDKIRDAMIEASYCHYVATTYGLTGSGLAIYSKYPIEEHNFEEWPSWTTNFENLLDSKGVLYAKIRKGEEYVHVFNLHTTSTSYEFGSQSDREEQFWQTRRMIDYKNINMNELVLVGGDMNTNRYADEHEAMEENVRSNGEWITGEQNYNLMRELLGAGAFNTIGNYNFTYDTVENPLTRSKYEVGEIHRQLLDYMLYDQHGLLPYQESFCEIIKPVDADIGYHEGMLSDHLPVTCNILYPTGNHPDHSPSDSAMFFAEVTILRATVCDADYLGGGASDSYIDVRIHVNDEDHECGKTSTIDNTNNPEWNEDISCSNYPFQATDRVLISFHAYDDDSSVIAVTNFIGTGITAVNPMGEDFEGRVTLEYGNCNEIGEVGHLFFNVHLREVQGS